MNCLLSAVCVSQTSVGRVHFLVAAVVLLELVAEVAAAPLAVAVLAVVAAAPLEVAVLVVVAPAAAPVAPAATAAVWAATGGRSHMRPSRCQWQYRP